MARDFVIHGAPLIKLRFGEHLSGIFSSVGVANYAELGLALKDTVRFTPRFVHRDIRTDDYGPEVPAEVMWGLAEVQVRMTLVHYDYTVLDTALKESMAGGVLPFLLAAGAGLPAVPGEGILAPAGSLMGNGLPLLSSGCHYLSLNILSPQLKQPYRLPASYLTGPPMVLPIGAERSAAELTWRCIPYQGIPELTQNVLTTMTSGSPGLGGGAGGLVNNQTTTTRTGEVSSSGVALWYRTTDGPTGLN